MKTLFLSSLLLLLLSCNNNAGKKETKQTEKQEETDVKQGMGSNNFGMAEISMDPSLKSRINDYFQLTMELDFTKLMDYIYPKIFEQAPRDQMIREIKGTFENEQMKAQIDSIHINKVTPAFKVEEGEYVKVYYTMRMRFDFKGDLEEDKKINEQMIGKFGQQNVTMDPESGVISVVQTDSMIAVKDKISKDWTFISAKKEMVDAVFSDAVLAKLDELE